MSNGPVIAAATPEVLCAVIRSAASRLVVVAPAVSTPVAEAICERWRVLGPHSVAITVDVDPEVYRLGYGDIEGLQRLETTGAALGGMLQRHIGVRIGVVIADDRVLVYSPVPALIEAGPRDPAAPNAILLDDAPAALLRAVGVSNAGHAVQEIGLDKASRQDIAETQENLARNPPQSFDIARKLRVFNAAFQFVELEMTGTNVSRHTVRIPNHLLGIADDATREQLRTVLSIVPSQHELSGKPLAKARHRLIKTHLQLLPGYGYVVLRANKHAFLEDLTTLTALVDGFRAEVNEKLEAQLTQRVAELAKALLPAVKASPPMEWLVPTGSQSRDERLLRNLKADLKEAIGSPHDYAGGMHVRVSFKDVTYESLSDKRFLAVARKVFPNLDQLHEEYDAAVGPLSGG